MFKIYDKIIEHGVCFIITFISITLMIVLSLYVKSLNLHIIDNIGIISIMCTILMGVWVLNRDNIDKLIIKLYKRFRIEEIIRERKLETLRYKFKLDKLKIEINKKQIKEISPIRGIIIKRLDDE